MNLFIITNNTKIFILLWQNNKNIIFEEVLHQKKFSEIFFEKIQILLEKNKISFDQIKAVYAGVGPGSYLIHRSIITFLKTTKILQKKCKIFTINNLIYQAGTEEKVISLIEANKKQNYIFIIKKDKVMNKKYSIDKDQLAQTLAQYKDYLILQNLEQINHLQQFSKIKHKFQEIVDWKNIKTIEL